MSTDTAVLGGFDRKIQFGGDSYDYHLRTLPDPRGLAGRLRGLKAGQFILVADTGVPPEIISSVRAQLSAVRPCQLLGVVADEHAKNAETVIDLIKAVFSQRANRSFVVVTLGGGLAGNVGGLMAAWMWRGTRLVHLPTTPLAAWDSTISFKNAVNLEDYGKNLIGAFWAPEFVWADLTWTRSLPPSQFVSGTGELAKNVLAAAPGQFDWLAARLHADGHYTPGELAELAEFGIVVKQKFMRLDSRETGQGIRFEYGHTAAHLFQLLLAGGMPHGIAVGLGMLVAARAARDLGFLSADDEQAHRDLLKLAGIEQELPRGVPAARYVDAAHYDNKRGYISCDMDGIDPDVHMVLLDELGGVHMENGSLITRVPDQVFAGAIASLMPAGSAS